MGPRIAGLIVALALLATAAGVWVMRFNSPADRNDVVDNPSGPLPAVTDDAHVERDRSQPALTSDDVWFTTITELTGIDFRHDSGTNSEKPFPAANGSGIAAIDYDLDGRFDLYFATGTPFPIDEDRPKPTNRFYRNLGSERFQDISESSGLAHNGYSAGLAIGDYDSDGFPDVYVNCFGKNVLFRNQGDGIFEPVTEIAGVGEERWGTSAAFLDFDDDGLLDLYVCNYAKWTWETRRWCGNRARNVRIHCSPHSVEAETDVLYRNQGDGTFSDETEAAGLAGRAGRAQGVIAADLNRDGRCDLYIGNDLHANALFMNAGGGKFEDTTELSCVGYDYKGSMQAGMGVDAADINADGFPELFVTNFQNEHNALYINTADGLFQEASQQKGLYAEGFPWVGWGTAFADFDLDGSQDLVVTNGHVDDNLHLLGEDSPYAQPALLWRQEQGKFRFVGTQAGEHFAESHCGRALVLIDLDNDCDSDIVIGHQDAEPAVLRNERLPSRDEPANVYSLRLIGTRSNREAVGATINARSGDVVAWGQVKGGGSYLSSHDPRRNIAMPVDSADVQFEIQWPSGKISAINELQPGVPHVIIEPRDDASPPRIFSVP